MEPATNTNNTGKGGLIQLLLEPVFSGFMCLLFSVFSLYEYIGYHIGEGKHSLKSWRYISPDERLTIATNMGMIALVFGVFCVFGLWTVYKPTKPTAKPVAPEKPQTYFSPQNQKHRRKKSKTNGMPPKNAGTPENGT